jgi:hypothetical protein
VLVFAVETGQQVDFDLRGTLEEVLSRTAAPERRPPGRPRLGVTSREVTLLPRHWEWLDDQPGGNSAALRRLVEQAIKIHPGKDRARRVRAALSRFLTSMAGDRAGYEEASRALFAGDTGTFERLLQRWPRDVREFAVERARDAAAADRGEEPTTGASGDVVNELYRVVWSEVVDGKVAGHWQVVDRLGFVEQLRRAP